MKEATTQNSLRPIDDDLLGILVARDCPLPPEAALRAPDPSRGYHGTEEDFIWALKMRREVTRYSIERNGTEARKRTEANPAVDSDDPTVQAATEFLRKMLEAEASGIAHWTGTPGWSNEVPRWILNSESSPPSKRKPEHASAASRRKFAESDIRQSFRKVRQTSPDSWSACCPAHHDRNPSVTIRRGRIHWLFKCWSQRCSWNEILQAVGLGDVDTRIGASR